MALVAPPLIRLKRLTAIENFAPYHGIFRHLRVDDSFETAVAFATTPMMTILLLAPILGPFGGDQLIVALNALRPEA